MTSSGRDRAPDGARAMRRPAIRSWRRTAALVAVTVAAALVLAGCAATNTAAPAIAGAPGFWLGVWQGMILPIAFLVSLFDDHVAVYAVPNSGHLYDLGFVIGACVIPLPTILFGGGRARRRRAAR
ncbi:hypothetical protein GCM10023403_21490 [Pseudonocardia benzenivorans]